MACIAVLPGVTAGAAATVQPDPTSGVCSHRRIALGPTGVLTWCVAAAGDGSVWALGGAATVENEEPARG